MFHRDSAGGAQAIRELNTLLSLFNVAYAEFRCDVSRFKEPLRHESSLSFRFS